MLSLFTIPWLFITKIMPCKPGVNFRNVLVISSDVIFESTETIPDGVDHCHHHGVYEGENVDVYEVQRIWYKLIEVSC